MRTRSHSNLCHITLAATLMLLAATGCRSHRQPCALFPGNASNEGKDVVCGLPEDTGIGEFQKRHVLTVYFDFDTAELRADARESLKANAQTFQKFPKVMIQIAGHCDERGTQAYNLALGERRAQAVREYLLHLGIPADHLSTISYGKEQPADPGHDESALSKNRRCEFNLSI